MCQNKPKVSVIIPVYNTEKYLRECLDSVVNQTLKDIEIICVDDCSDDGSKAILEEYAARDERIRPLYYEQRRSANQARKDGVMLAQGTYIMFLDSDDALELNACEELAREMDARRVNILQFGTFIDAEYHVHKNTHNFMTQFTVTYQEPLHGDEIFRACFVEHKFRFSLWNKIYRTELCKKAFAEVADGYFPKAQDVYAFFFLAWYAESFCGIGKKYYHYKYGRGITGGGLTINIDSFRRICSQYHIAQKCREFLIRQNKWDEYSEAWEKLNSGFAEECVSKWFRLLDEKDGGEGFDEMVNYWGYSFIMERIQKNFANQMTQAWAKMSGSKALIKAGYSADPADAEVPDGFARVIPVVFACDENYAPYGGVAIQSILENAGEGHFYRVYVLHSGFTDDTIRLLEAHSANQLSVRCLNVEPIIDGKNAALPERNHFSKGMYYRLVIPEVLSFYSQVIYLDCDLVVTRDIANMLPADMGDNLLAAVRNVATESARKRLEKSFNLDAEKYFFSGALVINISQWNAENTIDKCFTFLKETPANQLAFPDQDILNVVCQDRVFYLDIAWNFPWHMVYGHASYVKLCEQIVDRIGEDFYVLHFATSLKPWSHPELALSRYFWKYARQTPFYEEILMNSFTATTIQNRVSVYRDSSPKPMDYQEKTIMELRQEIEDIHSSWSYRIGRFITFIPRKIRGGIRCYREHGWDYTFERFLIHMKIHKE